MLGIRHALHQAPGGRSTGSANLINGVDAEGLHVEELVEELARLLVRRADRGLAEITPGHLG